MPSNGLTEDQVAGELNKMVEFIKKEAEEKAKEIKVKANEEYEIEKASIVRSEIAAIDQTFQQRYKQSQLAEQIAKSTQANKTRLKVLDAKEQALEDVFAAAQEQIKKVPSDKAKYEKLLTSLIVEAIGLLKEDKVAVQVREADKDVAEKALAAALKSEGVKDVTATIDSLFLDKQSAGGVVVFSEDRKVSIDNTLDERLKLLSESGLPLIRLELFGPSETRKFFD